MLYGLVFCWGLWVIDYKLIACFLLTQEVGTCIQPFPLHLSLSQRVCTEILAVFFFWRRSWLCGFLLYISYGLFLDEYFSSCTLLQFYFGSFFFFFFWYVSCSHTSLWSCCWQLLLSVQPSCWSIQLPMSGSADLKQQFGCRDANLYMGLNAVETSMIITYKV